MRRSDRMPVGPRSVSRRAPVPLALLLAVILGFATGCTIPGSAVPAYPDPASMDSGAYSVEPLREPPGAEKYGRVVESARLAEVMVDPAEIEATLAFTVNAYGVLPLPTAAKAGALLGESAGAVLRREGMLAGCAVAGTDAAGGSPAVGAARVVSVAVLRLPDADAAQRAARDMNAADRVAGSVPVFIPGHAAAQAHWRPGVPTLSATVARDAYVISVLAGHTAADLTALSAVAQKAMTLQISRLTAFAPTPADRIASLPLDREGMIRRLVPGAPDRWPYPAVVVAPTVPTAVWDARIIASGVVYGSRAAALLQGVRSARRPIEAIALNTSNVLTRYSNAADARGAFGDAVRAAALNETAVTVPGPEGMPDVLCLDDPTNAAIRYTCRLLVGRYVAVVNNRELATLRQRVVAQYGLLVSGAE